MDFPLEQIFSFFDPFLLIGKHCCTELPQEVRVRRRSDYMSVSNTNSVYKQRN